MICKYCDKDCEAHITIFKKYECDNCNVSYYEWYPDTEDKYTVVNIHTKIKGKEYYVQYRPHDMELPCRIVGPNYDADINFTFALNINPSNIKEKLKLYLTFL